MLFVAIGCEGYNKPFVKATHGNMKVILPKHKFYIDNDATLDADSKALRKKTCDEYWAMVEKAMKDIEEKKEETK